MDMRKPRSSGRGWNDETVKTVTRISALPIEDYPRVIRVLHEWEQELPYVPEGGMLCVGDTVYRVRYRSVRVDEPAGTVTTTYTVQDWRANPRA
jgi:hypothetical protein